MNIKPIKVKELDTLIAKLEKGKKEVSIGNIREIRKIIDDLIKNDPAVKARYAKLVK